LRSITDEVESLIKKCDLVWDAFRVEEKCQCVMKGILKFEVSVASGVSFNSVDINLVYKVILR